MASSLVSSIPCTELPNPFRVGDSDSPKMTKKHQTTPWPSESAILVAVRVRPFSPEEETRLPLAPTSKFNFSADASLSTSEQDSNTSKGSATKIRKVVDALDDHVLIFDPPDPESLSKFQRSLLPVQAYRKFKDMRFAFDRVFNEDAQQEEVFESTTRHLIDGVLDGYNGTLFAYGATGCGKTHTISGTPEKPGIIFLTMQELYERMKEREDEKTVEISVSYLEVYNETIRDLLVTPDPAAKHTCLHMREDSAKKIIIAGLSEHHPAGIDELMELVFKGNEQRTVSPTEANAASSRSHAVLQINVCQRSKTADISEDFTMATLSLIDLAGSERASVTKNQGRRLTEGANINKSLLSLGNCINALCENRPKAHIPYRDSKLTRLLKFSLGGNCKTVMIACVSPSSQHYEETQNTLKYANRAKNIKTKVSKNTLNIDRHVSEYVQVIYELRQEVAELKGKIRGQGKTGTLFAMSPQNPNIAARKSPDTTQRKKPVESKHEQLQDQLLLASEELKALHRWKRLFGQPAKALDLQLKLSGTPLSDAIVVDRLIHDLGQWIELLTRQLQEQGKPMAPSPMVGTKIPAHRPSPVALNVPRTTLHPGKAAARKLSLTPKIPVLRKIPLSPKRQSGVSVAWPASPEVQRISSSPRKASKPSGIVYSPSKMKKRGVLKNPLRVSIPTKRRVTFSLDVIAKDERRNASVLPNIPKPSPVVLAPPTKQPQGQPMGARINSISFGGGPMRGVNPAGDGNKGPIRWEPLGKSGPSRHVRSASDSPPSTTKNSLLNEPSPPTAGNGDSRGLIPGPSMQPISRMQAYPGSRRLSMGAPRRSIGFGGGPMRGTDSNREGGKGPIKWETLENKTIFTPQLDMTPLPPLPPLPPLLPLPPHTVELPTSQKHDREEDDQPHGPKRSKENLDNIFINELQDFEPVFYTPPTLSDSSIVQGQ